MKAWLVREKDEFCATVVFAETRGKARVVALGTDACSEAEFCDIEVRRIPSVDKYYKEGKEELDWFDEDDRIILVKECNFRCEVIELYRCEDCPAKQNCDGYKDKLEWMELHK